MDILHDTFERLRGVLTELGVLSPIVEDHIAEVERSVRRDWAGDRPYIARHAEDVIRQLSERNRAILRDWHAGERVDTIARKYGISKKRVYAILKVWGAG